MSSKTVCARSPAPRTDRDPNGAMTEPSTARLEWFLGIALVLLAAQVHALPFYRAHGFEAEGAEYEEAGIPHRNMRRRL